VGGELAERDQDAQAEAAQPQAGRAGVLEHVLISRNSMEN